MTSDTFTLTPPASHETDARCKINLAELTDLYFVKHWSGKKLAEHFGVHQSTITKNVQKLKARMTTPLKEEHVQELIKLAGDVVGDLKRISKILKTELRFVQDYINRVESETPGERIKLQGPLLRISDALQKNISGYLETQKIIYSVESINMFIDEVLEAIDSVSPHLKHEILQKLKSKGPLFEALAGDRSAQRSLSSPLFRQAG